jgi:virginiamycin A acetyltransferase
MLSVPVGHDAIVASGSVVANDAPGYSSVGGYPARLIRRRYANEDIERLLALAW